MHRSSVWRLAFISANLGRFGLYQGPTSLVTPLLNDTRQARYANSTKCSQATWCRIVDEAPWLIFQTAVQHTNASTWYYPTKAITSPVGIVARTTPSAAAA